MSTEEKKGFFEEHPQEEYAGSGSGAFLTPVEKEVLIDEGAVFSVTGVTGPYETKYRNERYIVNIELEGEPRAIGFTIGSVLSRDRMLVALQDYLADGGEGPDVILVREGRSLLLKEATK